MRILVIEDDEVLRDGLVVGLGLSGYTVEAAANAEDGRLALFGGGFDAAVVDVMLPDGSGLVLLKELRERGDPIPVLVLTARDRPADKVAGLDLGADDYLGKPFDIHEVAARLRAIARRARGRATGTLTWRDITVDPSRQTVEKSGVPVRLSRREFAVLEALVEQPGVILSKRQLEERLYGWNEEIESNSVEVHVHHLRAKLGAAVIETVRGVGYRVPS